MIPEFPAGEWFSTLDDAEVLSADTPWQAAEEALDRLLSPRMTPAEVEAEIRRPLTITAYKRDEVSDSEIESWAVSLVESLAEKWGDEYGDPEEPAEDRLPDDADEAMLAVVTKIVRGMQVWRCAGVGSVELTGEQVVEWARQERPDWFEAVPSAAEGACWCGLEGCTGLSHAARPSPGGKP